MHASPHTHACVLCDVGLGCGLPPGEQAVPREVCVTAGPGSPSTPHLLGAALEPKQHLYPVSHSLKASPRKGRLPLHRNITAGVCGLGEGAPCLVCRELLA